MSKVMFFKNIILIVIVLIFIAGVSFGWWQGREIKGSPKSAIEDIEVVITKVTGELPLIVEKVASQAIDRVVESVKNIGQDISIGARGFGRNIRTGAQNTIQNIRKWAQRINPFEARLVAPLLGHEQEELAPFLEYKEELVENEIKDKDIADIIPKQDQLEISYEELEKIRIAEMIEQLDDIAEMIDILSQEIDEIRAKREKIALKGLIENEFQKEVAEKIEEEEEEEEDKTEEDEKIEKPVILCQRGEAGSPRRNQVIINEIAWMGASTHYTDEWIELKNISGSEINLTGWQLLDKDQQIKIIFTDRDRVSVNEFLLLERDDDNSAPNVTADFIYKGGLRNSNEALYLFDKNCWFQDKIIANPQWPAGDNNSKRTMERGLDLTWQTSANPGGTPKRENSLGYVKVVRRERRARAIEPKIEMAVSAEFPKILITEVQIDSIKGRGGTKDDWIEFYNPNDNPVDLSQWSIQRQTSIGKTLNKKNFETGNTIPKKGYFLIVSVKTENQELLALADMIWSFDLTPDNTVYLVNNDQKIESGEDENIVDKLGFGKAFSFERTPASNPLEGKSLGRKWKLEAEKYQDIDDNSQDFEIQNPTPKKENQSPTTEEIPPKEEDKELPLLQPILEVEPPVLNFSAEQGGENPESQFITIKNIGKGELNWTISKNYGSSTPIDLYWLLAASTSGTISANASSTIEISIDISNLDFGEYNATTTIKAFDNQNKPAQTSPQEIAVNLIIIPKEKEETETEIGSLLVVINEIAWMGTKASSADEWIELYNNTASLINLAGWKLISSDKKGPLITFEESHKIGSKNYFLIERTDGETTSELEDWIGSFGNGLSNPNCEVLSLYDKNDNLIDQTVCLEGNIWPAGRAAVPDYISMERINPKLSGTDSKNWTNNHPGISRNGKDAEGNLINGTPRQTNSVY